MKCNNYLKELDEQELKSINAGEKGSLLYWLGRANASNHLPFNI